jgi:hypothetical protein
MRFDRQGLMAAGFEGFLTVEELRRGRIQQVPSGAGVYVVLRESDMAPAFLDASTGGWFKGKDPSVSKDFLHSNWVAGTPVVYIGKGDGTKGLRGRLKQFIDFGTGRAVGHWGGRLTWQVEQAARFVVAWRLVEDGESARGAELSLFDEFEQRYGRLPFANLSH